MPQLHANGASIHYEVEGAGPPLLLIAGIASDSASWRPLVPLLAPTVSLVLIDNRGCGRTKADGPLSVVDMVSDCAALLDHLGPGTVNVLGHSLGGYLGLLLAAQHPHRVRRLVTLATGPLGSRSRALFRQLARLYPQMPPEDWFRVLFPWLFSDPFFASETSIANAAAASTLYPYRQSPADFARQVAALIRSPVQISRRSAAPCWPWPRRATCWRPPKVCGERTPPSRMCATLKSPTPPTRSIGRRPRRPLPRCSSFSRFPRLPGRRRLPALPR